MPAQAGIQACPWNNDAIASTLGQPEADARHLSDSPPRLASSDRLPS
jgi:hypothetical protein